jgi:hypothetical protein
MTNSEVRQIFSTASELFKGKVVFEEAVVKDIATVCEGYPYFAPVLGKRCIEEGNRQGTNQIDDGIFRSVLDDIRTGKAFPNLETNYKRAIGHSEDRAWLLALLAEQHENESIFDASGNNVRLKDIRGIAKDLDVVHIDQNLPRLPEDQSGPVLIKDHERPGVYEFVDPVFRCYVKLRNIG